jgi:hypothetical protein
MKKASIDFGLLLMRVGFSGRNDDPRLWKISKGYSRKF